MSRLRVMVAAGEPSGDRLAAGLAEALAERVPDVDVFGMGGARLEAAGGRVLQPLEEVSVVGLVEVLRHLPRLRRVMGRLERMLVEEKPDVLVPVDFPDFNLRLSKAAKNAGVPVVYFVSPQVWAWRRGRIHGIRRVVDHMLVLFRFEEQFYREAGVPVTFVGHPFAEPPPPRPSHEDLRRRIGLPQGVRTVAVLPGSRPGPVRRMLPIMLDSVTELRRSRPDLHALLPLAGEVLRALVDELAGGFPNLHVHSGDFPEILDLCEAGIVAAGTASLEAATCGLPVAIVYHMNPLSYLIGRRLVQVEHVALPNLVAGRQVLPELIQSECRPARIAEVVGRFLDDPEVNRRVRGDLAEVRALLGEPGVYERAADAVLGHLGRSV